MFACLVLQVMLLSLLFCNYVYSSVCTCRFYCLVLVDRNTSHSGESWKPQKNRIPLAKGKIMEELHRLKHVRYVVVICCEAMYLNCRSLKSCCQCETTRKNWNRLFVILYDKIEKLLNSCKPANTDNLSIADFHVTSWRLYWCTVNKRFVISFSYYKLYTKMAAIVF